MEKYVRRLAKQAKIRIFYKAPQKTTLGAKQPILPQNAYQYYPKFVDKMSQGPAQGGPFPENTYHVWVRESPKTGMGGFCL